MTLEEEIDNWNRRTWGGQPDLVMAAKLGEEAGEVIGAYFKAEEGRGTYTDVADELGDLQIVASVLAGRRGWTLEELRARRLRKVQERNGETVDEGSGLGDDLEGRWVWKCSRDVPEGWEVKTAEGYTTLKVLDRGDKWTRGLLDGPPLMVQCRPDPDPEA